MTELSQETLAFWEAFDFEGGKTSKIIVLVLVKTTHYMLD